VRYRQPDQACIVRTVDEHSLELVFEQAQRAVTPGQSVVLYDDENCLGGGIINWADTPPAMTGMQERAMRAKTMKKIRNQKIP
jgi:tRNA-specific 2-thiouridylase